ncbi:acetyl-CoA carboxylase biotin carboxylase subunit [Ferruginivarius sediminum]|uniref:Biotin carboxylase n=1 Tax=Ferruginivarius sediminum TaxID=2661937 RepID=A0A369T8P2_9PROT|nr:acetyl-CoA carboxylase biotin carboxylase subunit [Ferruginivarius sediminum]RDD61699.1 acetyl-CoA carboxylase biotin carboxylase subunit [Ferruginivarius sediminum]
MFDKILIANRGEIACRIIRTCRKLGIATVAVYSEADATALHVEMADEAVHVGPAASAESYLRIERIVQACKDTGAQAVHPGYGFLSENTHFAKALEDAGIVFIGPPAEAIAAMGDKITSKRLAKEAGVSTVPGHMGLIEDADEAISIAHDIGYPVMIKATAGGGGKGMRIARDDKEMRDGFRAARSEAKSSFADDRVFIEKFIEEPRHIEIQVLADSHGNVIHLGERECSIQRRHQKVIEEAPSPALDPEIREAMGEQAKALARAVNYRSAGTVEFIFDRDRSFYFLEMNTRLQVEHPVTELVTGLDLVEQMIRVAAGEKLPLTQDQVKMQGWALESRVYAEDPLRGFLPSIGRLAYYQEPEDAESVRVDTGVVEGSEITMYYDPMIAKLCTWGQDRDAAIDGMQDALDAYYVRGINHNMAFLADVMAKPRFRDGRLSTNFIAEEYPDGFHGTQPTAEVTARLVVVAAVLHRACAMRDANIAGQVGGHEMEVGDDWVVFIEDERIPVTVTQAGDGAWRVAQAGGETQVQSDWRPGEPLFHARLSGKTITVQVDRQGACWLLTHGGASRQIRVLRPRAAELAALMPRKEPPDLSKYLLSPMPGLLTKLLVDEGTPVKAGEELAIVEAMKMENVLRAERDGTVSKLHADPGANLAVDQAILEFE